MKKWLIPALVTCVSACQPTSNLPTNKAGSLSLPGLTFIEEVKPQAGRTIIPYQKFVLDNGLVVIVHEDHSDPLVHVDMTYHVGSGREELGKSGFAHFFEHMMFQGSENVADEQHFKIVTEAGGTMNGTTNSDRTNYYQTVPANQLEKMLWLEADRMGFLLGAVTQEKFEVQRETVKNERGQRIDNRPYGKLGERVSEALYPPGHPYSWPVIGYMDDLNAVNVNDLKEFFLRWYGPNNATLTIGGDIDVASTLSLVKKYFGSIPRGPEVSDPKIIPFSLENDRYISMEDNVHLPLIYMSYPTVNVRHEDEAALDLLSTILGSGKTSLLYKNLVKNQLTVQAQTSHPCSELACTFNLLALPHPASGKSLADIEKIIRKTLTEFEKRGVEDDDLVKAKAQMESVFVFGLQSVSGKVSQLAANQTFSKNPNYIEKDIARYANVTKEDVMRVYLQYLKGKHAVIMSVVPNGRIDMVAAKDNFTPAKRNVAEASTNSGSGLALRKAKDSFDRSVIPTAGVNKAVSVPKMWRGELDNGMKVLGSQSLETPTTSLLLKIPAGHYYESKDKAGVVSLLAKMLKESTSKRSAEDMSKALQKLGSTVDISVQNHYLLVNINSLTKNFDATMQLVYEQIMQPAFKPDEFDRVRSNAIQSVINQKKNAGYLSATAFQKLMHADNVAGTPKGGTEQSLNKVGLGDVKAFYNQQVKPWGSQVIVVSSLKQEDMLNSLSLFKSWNGKGKELELALPMPTTKTGVIYLVHKDNAAQSAIRIGKRTIKQDFTGEFYRSNLMNFPFGGAFNSRINLNLREDKGYTYGARSYFAGDKLQGQFATTAEVRADVTDKSVVEIASEFKRYTDTGITTDELSFMRKAINQKDALKYETPSAKLKFLAQILEYDLEPTFVKERVDIASSITADEVNKLAKKHLNLDDMIMVVVGNAPVLKPQLEALGYEVVEYKI